MVRDKAPKRSQDATLANDRRKLERARVPKPARRCKFWGSTGQASSAEKVKAGQEANPARDKAAKASQKSPRRSCDWGAGNATRAIHANSGTLSLITLFVSHEI